METLQPQMQAPDYSGTAVINGDFKSIKPSMYKGKYVVLVFYSIDFTFVCPTEVIAFSDRASEFRQLNCEIIACSCDSEFCHLAWINTPRKVGGLGGVSIPLIADKSHKISQRFGVLEEKTGVAYRGLFIIDGHNMIRQVTINDLPVGRSVGEIIRLVQAFQFTDVHGEVCPANWQPGRKAMKPTPQGAVEYFKLT